MKCFRSDLHIHTVLSPCGDLEMSPGNIVAEAVLKGLDIIGVTDHNSTRHCELVSRLAADKGITVLQGAEVTTKEEVHCLAFFEKTDALKTFQEFLDSSLPFVKNDPDIFGHQVQVDENEIIIYEEEKLLINALSKSLEETEAFVHKLDGLFIPAHVNRMKNSIYSQLGFLPPDLKADALEFSKSVKQEEFRSLHPETGRYEVIKSSDAHNLQDIGSAVTVFCLNEPTFSEIRLALRRAGERKIYYR